MERREWGEQGGGIRGGGVGGGGGWKGVTSQTGTLPWQSLTGRAAGGGGGGLPVAAGHGLLVGPSRGGPQPLQPAVVPLPSLPLTLLALRPLLPSPGAGGVSGGRCGAEDGGGVVRGVSVGARRGRPLGGGRGGAVELSKSSQQMSWKVPTVDCNDIATLVRSAAAHRHRQCLLSIQLHAGSATLLASLPPLPTACPYVPTAFTPPSPPATSCLIYTQ